MTPTQTPKRKILHCDCDCFYASIEIRDDPKLNDHPVAIGGSPQSRGVIATCNYLARSYGIHSAMASSKALMLCPSLILLPPNMQKYREASKAILDLYAQYTEIIEPLSLDEAYLDVSNSNAYQGSATLIAQALQRQVHEQAGITISAGVAPNKFLAKIASDWNKPNGLFVIRPQDIDSFVLTLPVKKLSGVGHVTAKKLAHLGITTCADLQKLDQHTLTHHFGRFGQRLHELSFGHDDRPVNPKRDRKSVSVELTYAQDLTDHASCLAQIPDLMQRLTERIQRAKCQDQIKKLVVKVRFSDFSITSKECVFHRLDETLYRELMFTALQRKQKPVRLLGLGVRLTDTVNQLDLF